MDEVLAILHNLQERMESLENSIEEMKTQQRPMSSKDYLMYLRKEKGLDLDTFLSSIKITMKDVRKLLEERVYDTILNKIDYSSGMRIFNNNRNTIYIYKDDKWNTMQKEDILKVQNAIYTKVRDIYRGMIKSEHKDLQREKIKELDYLEQRNLISQVKDMKHISFKHRLYKIIEGHTSA